MIYVGCTVKPVDNWMDILPMPTAPSNYKDPAKISAYIQAKLEELESGGAATAPLSGAIHEAVVLINGCAVTCNNGIELINQIMSRWDPLPPDQVVGYKIHRNLRLAAIEYVASGGPLPINSAWMLNASIVMRYGIDWFDPVSVLFGSSDEDIAGVCTRLGIEHVDLSSALAQAEFAKLLTERMLGK